MATSFQSASIREFFDLELSKAGVDCFAVFAEDLWQPGQLIPQDIDTALFFPEATYAAPDGSFHRDTFRKLKDSTNIPGIKCAFFRAARVGPGASEIRCGAWTHHTTF